MTADYTKAIQDHRIDLLCLIGQPVALIETFAKANYLMIENIAVLPTYQGEGLGKRLIAHAEQLAVLSGCSEVKLDTNKLMVENMRLYQKLNFDIDREEEFKGGIAIHMSKPVE